MEGGGKERGAATHFTAIGSVVSDGMIVVEDEVLRVDLSLNIGLLDDLGDLWSSALDVDFERLMLHQCTHYPPHRVSGSAGASPMILILTQRRTHVQCMSRLGMDIKRP